MSTTPESDRCFFDHVQVHRDAVYTWVRSRFPTLLDVENLVAETMSRVWRAQRASKVTSPRALLFTTARNLAVDQLRRDKIVPMESVAEIADLAVYEGGSTPADLTARNQEFEFLTQAIQSLPTKCRQVLTLRKIYGLSQKEIAVQLGISEHTVEAQVGQGMRRCAAYLARLGLP